LSRDRIEKNHTALRPLCSGRSFAWEIKSMSEFVSFPLETYRDYAVDAFKDFAPKADFTLSNAKALMWFTQLAYEYLPDQPAKIAAMQTAWGFTRIEAFESKKRWRYHTHGLIGERPDAVMLAFCGTDPPVFETVLTDLRIWRTPQKVHSGFAEAAAAPEITAKVKEAIEASRSSGRPFLIAGHSLGASIASLAALQALDEKHAPLAVYTYGMPRTGGAKFEARYRPLAETTYRLVNGADLVPTVPPSIILYRHVGKLLWCRTGEEFDAAGLGPAGEANRPKFPQSFVKTVLKGLSCFARLKVACAPRGPGPKGRLFKYLPHNIRVHLQDQYLNALGVKIDFEKT
jgi:triacylglycerol lipase